MAKDKKKKLKDKPKKEEKPFVGFEFKNFRLSKIDDLNWGIEKRNEKGEFSGTKRRYYPNLRAAISVAFEKMILLEEEEMALDFLVETIVKAKKELLAGINRLRLERPDIDID